MCYLQAVFKHETTKAWNSFRLVHWCSPDIQLWDAVVVLQLVLGCFCFPYLLWIVVLVYTYRQNLQENSTRHYRANTPGGDTRKLTQLSIINKESTVLTPTVIWQRHPTFEYPVNISAIKRKEFYALVVSCLNTACNNNNSVVITFLESFS